MHVLGWITPLNPEKNITYFNGNNVFRQRQMYSQSWENIIFRSVCTLIVIKPECAFRISNDYKEISPNSENNRLKKRSLRTSKPTSVWVPAFSIRSIVMENRRVHWFKRCDSVSTLTELISVKSCERSCDERFLISFSSMHCVIGLPPNPEK